MKGIARADGQPAADYEAVVMALSRLSQTVISERNPGGALTAAAETGAVLLQTDAAAVFLLTQSSSDLQLAACYQMAAPERKSTLPGEAAVRLCIEHKAPIVVGNLASDRRKGFAALSRKGFASLLCVPLDVGSRTLGALMVASKTLRAFSPSNIEVLSAVASQAAFAAWKSGLSSGILPVGDGSSLTTADLETIELASRKIQELSIINRVSEAVISILDLNELLELALEQCLVAVGANVGSIMLLDEESGRLLIRASKGLPKNVVDSASVPIGEGISGWVAQHGKPVLVHDARNDPRFRMRRYRDDISSAMSVPLKARGRVIGVLNVSTTEAGCRYGPREVEFLCTMANQVAMAIDNAQLYERLNRRSVELASLLQVSEAITSTLDLRHVLSVLSERFMAMTHVDACALLGFDADTGRFRCLDGKGLTTTSRKSGYLEAALPIAMHALAQRQPVCCGLTAGSEFRSDVTAAEGFASAVGVPLSASGRPVGSIVLFLAPGQVFPPSDLQMLASVGGLAGIAIHNALVYQAKYEIARALQFQLVPTVPLIAEGLEIGHKFLPAREVGGDYYDVIKVADTRVGIIIADVAGNSVPAAMYTSMGKHVLRAYAIEDNLPADVLRRLNRLVCDEVHPEIFISLFYGVFDASNRSFRYVCAGHEPPLLYRPDGSFDRLTADGLLVGVTPFVDYEEKYLTLDSGSVLILFTDGVVDSQGVKAKFDIEGMKSIVAAHALKPAQELADNIYTRLVETTGVGMQDDAALLVLKVM